MSALKEIKKKVKGEEGGIKGAPMVRVTFFFLSCGVKLFTLNIMMTFFSCCFLNI